MMKKIFKKIVVCIITLLARVVLYKYAPKIIAVTGSVGKTSTKDAICIVLKEKFFVRCSPKTYNSEVGVPLTILGCENGWESINKWIKVFLEGLALIFLKNHYPALLVVEVGADRPGDIAQIAKWLKPDTVVVTRFSDVPAHVEFFPSRESLFTEKANLVKALKPNGTLILNADDEDVLRLKEKAPKGTKITTFGIFSGADIEASDIRISYDAGKRPEGIQCKIKYGDTLIPLKLKGTTGFHHVSTMLAALLVGVHEKLNMITMIEALLHYTVPRGRLKILSGIHNSLILDDTYNASPVAVRSALDSLEKIEMSVNENGMQGRKIVALGDMLELGIHSVLEHRKVGERVAEVADIFVAVGLRMEVSWESSRASGMDPEKTKHFNTASEARDFLKSIVEEGDIILVKGSQSMRMERVVEALLAEPEKKHELLVRQEKEWEER